MRDDPTITSGALGAPTSPADTSPTPASAAADPKYLNAKRFEDRCQHLWELAALPKGQAQQRSQVRKVRRHGAAGDAAGIGRVMRTVPRPDIFLTWREDKPDALVSTIRARQATALTAMTGPLDDAGFVKALRAVVAEGGVAEIDAVCGSHEGLNETLADVAAGRLRCGADVKARLFERAVVEARPSERLRSGSTLLHCLANDAGEDGAWLIDHALRAPSADVNATDADGRSAVADALRMNNEPALEAMLRHGSLKLETLENARDFRVDFPLTHRIRRLLAQARNRPWHVTGRATVAMAPRPAAEGAAPAFGWLRGAGDRLEKTVDLDGNVDAQALTALVEGTEPDERPTLFLLAMDRFSSPAVIEGILPAIASHLKPGPALDDALDEVCVAHRKHLDAADGGPDRSLLNERAVRLLMQAGADPNAVPVGGGRSIVHRAIDAGNAGALRVMSAIDPKTAERGWARVESGTGESLMDAALRVGHAATMDALFHAPVTDDELDRAYQTFSSRPVGGGKMTDAERLLDCEVEVRKTAKRVAELKKAQPTLAQMKTCRAWLQTAMATVERDLPRIAGERLRGWIEQLGSELDGVTPRLDRQVRSATT
ncbi:MAG: hypothetical protein ABW032_11310 [Burkholderiaceae bacterium]